MMRKLLLATVVVLFMTSMTHAQEAWFEAAESCAVEYEVTAMREIPAQPQEASPREAVSTRAIAAKAMLTEVDRAAKIDTTAVRAAAAVEAVVEPEGWWRNPGCGGGEPEWVPGPRPAIVMVPVCFAEDTLVITSTGAKKISEVKVGEKVLTEAGFKEVVEVLDSDLNPTISINGIETTDAHLFVMDNEEMKEAKDLKIGDILYGGIEVKSIEKISDSNKRVYNLDLEGSKYYVRNILIHNSLRRVAKK